MTNVFAAVDLGASGGRVLTGRITSERLEVAEQARFPNAGIAVGGRLYWDILRLWKHILDGLRLAAANGPIRSVGVDGWAVDYGLLDRRGELLGAPRHYRDARNTTGLERLVDLIDPSEHYRRTGTALLPIVTAAQLLAESEERLEHAERLLMVPDLVVYWLTGRQGTEVTNASTTGLLAASAERWDDEVVSKVGLDPRLLAPLRQPGENAGNLQPDVAAELALHRPIQVTVVASHDTASAVAAVPAATDAFGYVSAGTWSLVGVETHRPVLTESARSARFTNERGVDGTTRLLRNVMGLWLLQESYRIWQLQGVVPDLDDLLASAGRLPALQWTIDVDAPELLAPGDIPARIAALCRAGRSGVPKTPPEMTRCIVDSLALAHRRALREVQALTGLSIEVVHVVGGGARNGLLCQATADACGLPVIAGPAEATAVGNLLVQARAADELGDDLKSLRACVRRSAVLVEYEPGATEPWDRAHASLE
jgi:rhamnulokinase